VGLESECGTSEALRAADGAFSNLLTLPSGSIRGILTRRRFEFAGEIGAFARWTATPGQGARGCAILAQMAKVTEDRQGGAGRLFGEAEPGAAPGASDLQAVERSAETGREFRAIASNFSGIRWTMWLKGVDRERVTAGLFTRSPDRAKAKTASRWT